LIDGRAPGSKVISNATLDTISDMPDSGPLAGLLVADFSRVLAGPYATMLLADLGADVIKVERPGAGDDTRAWGPPYGPDGMATYFAGVNRNKRSVTLDLSAVEDRVKAIELARRADVLVENFKPGNMDRLGLGYDAMRKVNPRLVYASITGFGTGAGRGLPGYDLMVQAVGGLMSITGADPEHPTKVGVALVDVITGLHAVVGIQAALAHRERTGEGQHVEVSLLSSLLSGLVNQGAGYVGGGSIPSAMGNAHPSISPYEVYSTADHPFAVAVGNDGQFRSFVHLIGRADLADDARFRQNTLRVTNRVALKAQLDVALSARGADEWFELLSAAGVPCGPINDVAGAFALAERLGLEPIVEVPGVDGMASRMVANPIGLSKSLVSYRRSAPELGADQAEFLAWLAAGESSSHGI
jgi:crotonobetainyl-CoA:carnitine CoA-transferase CaiB-like acyl-CoA transferase